MRSRLALVAVLVLVAGAVPGCSSSDPIDHRSMPSFGDDRRPEQINSPGR